jgi:hypothetical protein
MDALDQVLQSLEQMANSGANYELDSYEVQVASDYEDFLVRQKGMSPMRAQKISRVAAANPKVGAMIRESAAQGGFGLGKQTGTPTSAAQTTITATRASRNITQPLPVPIFGAIDASGNFVRSLQGLLPAGVTVAAAYGQNAGRPNDLQLTYTSGANVDIIRVTCTTISYPTFLESTITDFFRIDKLRYSLSANQPTQFEQPHQIVKISMFGKNDVNTFNPGSYFDPRQFQNQVIDVPTVFDVDKETALVFNMIDVAGFSVSFTTFISKFKRQNAIGF